MRPFLLTVIIVAQTIVILLMLGLLVALGGGDPAPADAAPDLLRVPLNLLAAALPPLLAWLLSASSARDSWEGVRPWAWGEESLLREDRDEGLTLHGCS